MDVTLFNGLPVILYKSNNNLFFSNVLITENIICATLFTLPNGKLGIIYANTNGIHFIHNSKLTWSSPITLLLETNINNISVCTLNDNIFLSYYCMDNQNLKFYEFNFAEYVWFAQ